MISTEFGRCSRGPKIRCAHGNPRSWSLDAGHGGESLPSRTGERSERPDESPTGERAHPRASDSQRWTLDRRHLSYDYTRYGGRDWRFYEDVLDDMAPVPPVLDIGSGLGLFLECCSYRRVPAIGIELAQEGIEASASKGLPVVRGDVTIRFPFRDNVFGSALAYHILEHVLLEKERLILSEVLRVLRPGGFLFVVSPNAFHPDARREPDHVNLFTPHQLGKELRSAGFSQVTLGTNYWRPVWGPRFRLGRFGELMAGALWKLAPLDRFAWNATAKGWKRLPP